MMEKDEKTKPNLVTRRVSLWILILSSMMFVVCGVMFVRENVLFKKTYQTPPPVTPTPEMTMAAVTQGAPSAPVITPTPYVKRAPVHIYFPNQAVDMEVVPVGKDEEGRMDTIDSSLEAAWYEPGPAPGDDGNALINGHVRWKGVAGIFSSIKEMELYDPILTLHEDGTQRVFYVVHTMVMSLDDEKTAAEVMDMGAEKRVTLITCDGEFDRDLGTSVSRYIVYAKAEEDIEDFDPNYRYQPAS